jgi:mono/diheme cytochrome c family protein
VPLMALAAGLALGAPAAAQPAWQAPAAEGVRKNPLPPDAKTLERGAALARQHCGPCHGPGFRGDGPAAMALNPRPADWTSPRVQGEADGALFWKISSGRGAMPPWRHLPEPDRWALVRFIKSLGRSAAKP